MLESNYSKFIRNILTLLKEGNMQNKKIALVISLVIYAILLAIFYHPTIIADEDFAYNGQNVLFQIAPGFAVLAGIYAFRKYGIKSIHGMSILLITIGIALWWLGEIVWMVFDIVLGIDPFPSVADVFYLLAYPIMFIGIVSELRLGKIKWTTKKVILSVVILLLLSVITYYYGIFMAYDEEATLTENVVAISYGVGDLILLVGSIMLINLSVEFTGGIFSKAWVVFVIGMLLTWAADVLFAIYYEPYEAMEWTYLQMDHLWTAGYLFFGYSFLIMGSVIDKLKEFAVSKKK